MADPPWPYEDGFGGFNQAGRGRERAEVRRGLPYPSMSVEEISMVPVLRFSERDRPYFFLSNRGTNLFLWTTNRHLPNAFAVMARWGAVYRHTVVWHKTGANPNTGGLAPTSCEYLLYGTIGGGASLTGKLPDTLIETKRPANSHSRKPDVFLDEIERVSPGPYLEMFSRRARFGWDTHGDESLQNVELSA